MYSQALQGIMINSRQEWNIDYLRELREKFLDQDYPLKLVNSEFRRALEVDRTDLLFNKERKKKKKIIAPLIVNYNPGNPDFRKWINQEIDILHQSPDTKKTFPKIDVVTRQNKNIAQKVINSKHWKLATPRNNPPQPPPGNFVKHERNCVTCLRIKDGKKEFSSSVTKRNYKITRHYTCESTHLVYLARCSLCSMDYIGQTTQTMRRRHLGHRGEIRSGSDGLGKHFLSHGQNLDLKNERIFEENVMKYFELTIIASVEPGQPWSQQNLDRLEAKFQKNLMCMDYNGGINLRDESKRGRNAGR